MRDLTLSEQGLLDLYSLWSEDRYCASFMHPSEGIVHEFREWLRELRFIGPGHLEDYEDEMLEEFYRQEGKGVDTCLR